MPAAPHSQDRGSKGKQCVRPSPSWQVFDLTYAYKLGYKGRGPASVPWPMKRSWGEILADRLVDTVRLPAPSARPDFVCAPTGGVHVGWSACPSRLPLHAPPRLASPRLLCPSSSPTSVSRQAPA